MTTKAGNAPTAATTTLTCTHYYCETCNHAWPVTAGPFCDFCGEGEEISFEHHSPVPLGYRNDKTFQWTFPGHPDVWIYEARDPAP